MIKININKQIRCDTFIFPDKQPHINIKQIKENDDVQVMCSITDANTLLLLLQCSNALDNVFANKKELVIPYLMGARFDRLMQEGDSVDLKVIANLINGCGFDKVYLYDVHSDVSTVLIDKSINISNGHLVMQYQKENAILICPDAGAVKKVNRYFGLNKNISDVVYCNKIRNLSDGDITLKVLEPEGTFIEIIDSYSNTTFVRAELTPDQLSAAFSGLARVDCEVSVRNLERVGLVHCISTHEFQVANDERNPWSDDPTLRQQELELRCAATMPEGWISDNAYQSQKSLFERDGKKYARVTIRKWITQEEAKK